MDYEDDVSLSPKSPGRDVKTEDIKPDLGDAEDVYEDSLDLDTSQQHQRMMLVRLPEYLMDKLRSGEKELSGADIGKVLIPQGLGSNPKKLRVLLNTQIELLKPLPHRYSLNVQHDNVENVYVMREQEVKRRRKTSPVKEETLSKDQQREQHLQLQKRHENGIPDMVQELNAARRATRTALVGHAVNECTLTADLSDPNYKYVLHQRKLMELPQAERQTQRLDSMAGVGGAKYGASLRSGKETWHKKNVRRQQARTTGKATRLERNALLDLLFRSFEEQPYWTVKQLRERTRQPEMYLRSTLESIAVLIRRGPYAQKYGLREEYKHLQSSGATIDSMIEQAPAGPEFPPDEGDSDDMEMENVEF